MKNKKRSENSLTQSFKKTQKLDLEAAVPTARFLNGCFDKNRIKLLVTWSLKNCGQKMTIDLIEDLKTLGFSYATKAGISLGIDDLTIPLNKNKLLLSADKNIKKTQINSNQEFLTGIEKFQHLIDTWHRTSETLKQNVISHFKVTNILNPVYMMAFSGARGNVSQVRQLVGMRGLMADPQGQILDFPIKSNFREGITLTEYIISCYGARKGLVDTALKTANSGYLTRRLVDVSHHIIVFDFDCKTQRGVILTNLLENKKVSVPLQARLIGRILAENIYSEIDIQTKKTNINYTSKHSKSTKILNYFRKKESVKKFQNEVNNILIQKNIQRNKQNFVDNTLVLHEININSSKYFLFFYLLLLNNKKITNTNSQLNLFEKLQSIVLQKTQKFNQTLARRGWTEVQSSSESEDFEKQNQYQLTFNLQNFNNLNLLFFKIFLKFLSDACFYHTKHKLVALKNQEISAPLSLQISALKKTVLVRSPLTCEIKNSICQLCYGWGLAYGKLVPLGEAVGVIAAQSIGEPGTQLTMRTFHTGGVFSGDIMSEILAPFDGKIVFSSFLHGTLIRTSHGKIAFLTKIAGRFKIEKIIKSVGKTSLANQKENQLQIKPKKNKNDRKLASVESSSSSVILDQNKKNSEFFEIPSLTILFVRNFEFISKNKLIAEFSFMFTDANQRIQATSDLNAEIDGEIFFKKMLLKISKKNNQLISKTTCDLGSIWILSGKICKQPNSINLFAQPGDLVDTNSMIGEYQIVSPNAGFFQINKNLLQKKSSQNELSENLRFSNTSYEPPSAIINQLWLNYPLFCCLIQNIQYKKFAYFLKLFSFKKTKFLLTNFQIKDQYFFIGNSLNQIFLNSNNFAKKFVFKSLNKKYETTTGGKIILDKFYFNEKIYFGFIFWLNQQNFLVNNQSDFSCFSQQFQEKSICTDLAIPNLFLFFKVFKNVSEYTLRKQKLVYLTRLKKKNKSFNCNQSFVGEADFSFKSFLQTKQNFAESSVAQSGSLEGQSLSNKGFSLKKKNLQICEASLKNFKQFSTSTQIKLNQQKKYSYEQSKNPLASRCAQRFFNSNKFNLLVGKDKLQNRKIKTSLNFSNKNESVIFYYNSQGKFFNVYSKISGYTQFFYLSTFCSNSTQYFLWSQKNLPNLKTVKKVNSFFLPKLIKKTKTHFNYRFHQTSLNLNPGLGLSFLFSHNLKKKKKMINQKFYIDFRNHVKIQSTLLKNRNLEFKLKKQSNSRIWKKNFQSLKNKLINNTLTTDKIGEIIDFYVSCFYSRNVTSKCNKQKLSNSYFYQFHLANLYKNSKNVFLKNFFYSVKKHKTIKLSLLTKKKIIMVSPQFPWKNFKKNNNKIKRKFKFYFLANKIREKTLVLNLALCNTSFFLNNNYTTEKFCLEREILISKKANLKKKNYNQNFSNLSQHGFFYYPKTLTASSYSLLGNQTEKYKQFHNKKTLNIQIFLKPGTLSLFLYELNHKYNRKKFTAKKNKVLQNPQIQQSTSITKHNKPNIRSTSTTSSPILIPNLNNKTLNKIKIKPGWIYRSKNNTKNFINHKHIISPGKLAIQPILFDQYLISFECIVINQVLVKKNLYFSKKKNDLINQIQFKKITTQLKKQIVNDSTLKYNQKNSTLIKIVVPSQAGFDKNKNRKQNQKFDKKNFQRRFGNFQGSTENFFNKKILKFCFLLKNNRSLFFYNTKVVSAIKNTKKIKNNKFYLIYEIFLLKKNLYSAFLTEVYSQSRQSISKNFFPEKSLFIIEQIHKATAIAQSKQKKNLFSGKTLAKNHLKKRFFKFNKNKAVYPVSKINFAELKIAIFQAIHLKKKKCFIQQKNYFNKTLLKQTLYKIYFLKNENFNTVKNFLTINKNKTEKKLTKKVVKIFFINQPLILKKNLVINQNCAKILYFCKNEHFFSETKIKPFLVEQKKQVFKDSISNIPLFKLKNFHRNLENFNYFLVQKNILSNSNKKIKLKSNFVNFNRTSILSLKTTTLCENLFVVSQKISEFSFFNLKKYKKIISKQNSCFCISNTKKFTTGLFEKKIQSFAKFSKPEPAKQISNIYRFQNSQNSRKKFKLIKKITTNFDFLLPDQKLFFNPFILTQLSIKQNYSESLNKSINQFKNVKLRTYQFKNKVKISKSSVKQVLGLKKSEIFSTTARVNFIHFQSNNKQYNIELFLPVPSTDFHIKYCFKHTFSKKILFLKNMNLLEHFIYFNIPNQYKYNYIKILLCSASNIKKYLNIVICLKYKLSSQPFLNTKQFKNLNRSFAETKFLFSQKNYVLPQTPIENTSLLSFFCGEILKSGLYRKKNFNRKTDINKNKVRDEENLSFVLNPHKSQNYLILTHQDKIKFHINPITNCFAPHKLVKKKNNTDLFFLGKNIRYGSKINTNLAVPTSGILIQIEKSKIILRKTQSILFSPKGLVAVYSQDIIEKNTLVLSLFYQRLKSGDIVQGIPRIEQLFEARKTNQGESLSYSLHEHLEDIFLYYIKKYNFIQAARYSLEKIQQIIVNNVQKVYKSQAVTIADKHLEIIIRQMTSKVQIIRSGQTSLLPGEIVDLDWIELINKNIEKKKAKYVPIILGITRKSLETKSFLSEASFQETTRVLSKSAIKRKTDFLKGLKENVILGHLVPAGTGFHANTGLYKKIFNSIILKYYENETYESYIIFRKFVLKIK